MKDVKRKKAKKYKNKKELNIILKKYNNKLYTFFHQLNKEDKVICDLISIRLTRLAQRGNILAEEKLIFLLRNLVNYWIEEKENLSSWNGYDDRLIKTIGGCIRRFRYAGSFVGYLYRTLESSGRGLTLLEKFSLDSISVYTNKKKIETFINK